MKDTLDPVIDQVILQIKNQIAVDGVEGALNYAVTRIVVACMKPTDGWNYRFLARASAVFGEAQAEFRRRLMAPYEDSCIARNGDIESYSG